MDHYHETTPPTKLKSAVMGAKSRNKRAPEQRENPYETWWWNEGSGMRPLPEEDLEEFTHRITRIAWENGEDTAKHSN